MATSTSSDSPSPLSISRPEYLSTLPPWRRFLARLNWHPVYEIEQETERLSIENEQLENENRRLAAIESRMLALLRSADSSSQAPPATDSN